MLSMSLASPMRNPSREPCSTWDEALMFSWPPAMMMSASPHLMACAAKCTAFRPLPHTFPIVISGTLSGIPERMSAWRAGFWPTPAVRTCPRMTSETCAGLTPVRASNALMIWAPRSAAGTLAIDPPNFPTAERSAAVMTTSFIAISPWVSNSTASYSGIRRSRGCAIGIPQIGIAVAVREVLDLAPHAQVTLRPRIGIAEARGEGDFHVLGDGQNAPYPTVHGIVAKGAEHLHADAETLGHQPQILHDASQAHEAEQIAFRGRCPEPAVMHDDHQQGAVLDRSADEGMERCGMIVLRRLRFLPRFGKHARQQSGLSSQQLGLRQGQLVIVFADESLRRRQVNREDLGQTLFLIDGDDFEILHIVSRGSPAGGVEHALQIQLPDLTMRVECGAARVSLPNDFEQVPHAGNYCISQPRASIGASRDCARTNRALRPPVRS